jgi:hypothetical protein
MNLSGAPTFYQGAIARTGRAGASANGSTNTCVRRFSIVGVIAGSQVTVTDDAIRGTYFKVLAEGYYHIYRQDTNTASGGNGMGISVGPSILQTADLSSGVQNLGIYENLGIPNALMSSSHPYKLGYLHNNAATIFVTLSALVWLPANAIVFPHDSGAAAMNNNSGNEFMIVKRIA